MAGRRTSNEPWGDGFVDDGWSALAAVACWEHVTADEYIRFFPGLGARPAAPLPAAVVGHLTEAVAVRVWRLGPAVRGVSLAGLDTVALADLGSRAADRWFAPPSMIARAARWLSGHRPPPRSPAGEDTGALLHLAGLLAIMLEGRTPPYTESAALTVAFHGGLHPAYLWSEAVAWADTATAAGWLGVIARGRAALMPGEAVAPLLDAVVLSPDGTVRLRDPRLAACGLSAAQWTALVHAAREVSEGRGMVVRLVPAGRRRTAKASANDPAMPAAAATSR